MNSKKERKGREHKQIRKIVYSFKSYRFVKTRRGWYIFKKGRRGLISITKHPRKLIKMLKSRKRISIRSIKSLKWKLEGRKPPKKKVKTPSTKQRVKRISKIEQMKAIKEPKVKEKMITLGKMEGFLRKTYLSVENIPRYTDYIRVAVLFEFRFKDGKQYIIQEWGSSRITPYNRGMKNFIIKGAIEEALSNARAKAQGQHKVYIPSGAVVKALDIRFYAYFNPRENPNWLKV